MNGGTIVYSFEEYKNRLLQDPEFKKEWDSLDPEFDEIRKTMKAKELSQKSLANSTTILPARENYNIELNSLNLF